MKINTFSLICIAVGAYLIYCAQITPGQQVFASFTGGLSLVYGVRLFFAAFKP